MFRSVVLKDRSASGGPSELFVGVLCCSLAEKNKGPKKLNQLGKHLPKYSIFIWCVYKAKALLMVVGGEFF